MIIVLLKIIIPIIVLIIRYILLKLVYNFIDKKVDEKFEEEFYSRTNCFTRLFVSDRKKSKINYRYTASIRQKLKIGANIVITVLFILLIYIVIFTDRIKIFTGFIKNIILEYIINK